MASKNELKVIGAGFGRTGTTSLQKALEILGVGPCYHLNEIIDGPDEQVQERLEAWTNVLENEDGEQAMELLNGFHSCVDLPAAPMTVELFKLNPDAKVILGIRDTFDEWFESASKTIFKVANLPNEPEEKLIIFKPNDGWEPICKLLNVPIPTVPYPSTNNRKAFLADKNQWRSEAVPA